MFKRIIIITTGRRKTRGLERRGKESERERESTSDDDQNASFLQVQSREYECQVGRLTEITRDAEGGYQLR